jgi:hypothetical protein
VDSIEAEATAKSIYIQAAGLAGLRISADSPERLADLVRAGFGKVKPKRRPEAAANLLRLVATALDQAQAQKKTMLTESSVEDAKDEVCPVYPFSKGKRKGSR